MDFKFDQDSGDSQQPEAAGEKKKQGPLLVLLLILVAGFTYVYFFTGLIKPQEEQKTTEAPVSAPQVVKMPLPPREGAPSKPAAKPETPKAPKATTATPAATPAAAPAKPAPPKAKEELKKVEATKPADTDKVPLPVRNKKGDKTPVAKSEEKKSVVAAKKPAVADKKVLPAKNVVKKPVSDDQEKPESVAKAKKTTPPSWSLVIGNYVLEEAMAADMGRVRKAGFEPAIKPSTRKKTTMNRLFVSDFNDRATAQATLDNLKHHSSDGFIIEQGGKFVLYAGSYLQNEAANSEKERLKAAGFSSTIKHVDIAIPAQSLTVGPFDSKKAADAALGKLKGAGIKATLSQK